MCIRDRYQRRVRDRSDFAMGIILDEPKFPVLNRAPSAGEVVANFSARDTLRWGGVTAAALPFGLAVGARGVRVPSMVAAGALGCLGGFLLSYQQSAGRLLGMLPPN
eukprot:TRINITY_DN10818_c0_g1_i1.p1 TRINITY_DN10818_c0_g1~~TRINITY_DN10818_c0_g1_i1.p1  ORF type:complete len:107 (+),score=12.30 TRINITY_DN10818_c0_g1_i1:120-440(+)